MAASPRLSTRHRRRRRGPGDTVPWPVVVLAVLGGGFLLLPLVGLLQRAPWSALPSLLGTDIVRDALGLSLLTASLATLVSLVLGVPLAWTLARVDFPGRPLVRALVTLPMVLPPVVGGAALLFALGRRGLIGGPLDDHTGIVLPYSTAGVVVAEAFVAMPFLVLTVEAAFRSMDRRYEEAAATLGAGPWTTFSRVTLPAVGPSVLAGAVLCWSRALGEFGATLTFAGNLQGRTQTMPLAVYLALERDREAALALSLVQVAVALAVLLALRHRWWPAVGPGTTTRSGAGPRSSGRSGDEARSATSDVPGSIVASGVHTSVGHGPTASTSEDRHPATSTAADTDGSAPRSGGTEAGDSQGTVAGAGSASRVGVEAGDGQGAGGSADAGRPVGPDASTPTTGSGDRLGAGLSASARPADGKREPADERRESGLGGLEAEVVVRQNGFELDVQLEVADGEVMAVVGANGAGKTTLLRAVAGLLALDAGQVRLDGIVVDDVAGGVHVPTHRRDLGLVFQDLLLFAHMSALDNVAFGLRRRGEHRRQAHERAAAWLERLGVADYRDAAPATLSRGQAQRVALARALASEPALLLLDEPLASVDAAARPGLRAELRRHLATVAGVCLLVTHDPADAAALADRTLVLDAGRATIS